MNYDGSEESYRCIKTDFHHNRNVVITVGVTKFHGSVLKGDDYIIKLFVMVVTKKVDGGNREIIKSSEVTVHSRLTDLRLEII